MSLQRTYRMPCRHSRSATGRGPGDRSGQAGSRGSISAHKSSSTIHGRVLTPPRTAESSHRSRSTRTSHQDPVTSSTYTRPMIDRLDCTPPGGRALANVLTATPVSWSVPTRTPKCHRRLGEAGAGEPTGVLAVRSDYESRMIETGEHSAQLRRRSVNYTRFERYSLQFFHPQLIVLTTWRLAAPSKTGRSR